MGKPCKTSHELTTVGKKWNDAACIDVLPYFKKMGRHLKIDSLDNFN